MTMCNKCNKVEVNICHKIFVIHTCWQILPHNMIEIESNCNWSDNTVLVKKSHESELQIKQEKSYKLSLEQVYTTHQQVWGLPWILIYCLYHNTNMLLLYQCIDVEVTEQFNINVRSHIHVITLFKNLQVLKHRTLSTKPKEPDNWKPTTCMHKVHTWFMWNGN
jgi:hypothetical protein